MQYKDRFGRYVTKADAYVDGVLKDGYAVAVPMLLADSGLSTVITDAKRAFADSAEGQRAVAWARRKHDLSEAYKGAQASPFSDADTRQALDEAFTEKQASDAEKARMTAELPNLRDRAQLFYEARVDRMNETR